MISSYCLKFFVRIYFLDVNNTIDVVNKDLVFFFDLFSDYLVIINSIIKL